MSCSVSSALILHLIVDFFVIYIVIFRSSSVPHQNPAEGVSVQDVHVNLLPHTESCSSLPSSSIDFVIAADLDLKSRDPNEFRWCSVLTVSSFKKKKICAMQI